MEDNTLDLLMLAKRIEKQEQFTRMVSLVCCISVLSVMFYTVTEIFSDLPQLIVVHAMSNMGTIVTERHLVDSSINGQAAALRNSELKKNELKNSELKNTEKKSSESKP